MMEILPIEISPFDRAFELKIPDGYWWCINMTEYYKFYYFENGDF
jgi:hypothetical protein